MKKNHTKYGPTGILWALYLVVGVVAFLVSNFYFKFTLQDAIIFGAVNLVVVIAITEGIDFLFKKAKLRQERKAAEETPGDEPSPDAEGAVATEAEPAKDSTKDDAATTEPSSEPVVGDEESANDATPPVTGRPEKKKGLGYFARSKKALVAEASVESEPILETAQSAESEIKEAIVGDEAVLLITGRPGYGKGYWDVEHLHALKDARDSVSADTQVTDVDANVAESGVESISPLTVETVTEPVVEDSSKPRGRRANPDAVIDAPTSSISIITPDMIKPRVEPVEEERVVEPVPDETMAEPATEEKVADEPAVEEPVAEEPYLSADEFLNTTKLTSPRAIVREYQRLGGKDDIFSILMERQK